MTEQRRRDLFDRFHKYYGASAAAPVVRELERRVLGVDFGGNGYTDIAQARELTTLLSLGPRSELVDVGAGAGWPGLFMAWESRCRVTLTDPQSAGLRPALDRAAAFDIAAGAVATSGEILPFRAASFDAVTHSDVLC